MNYLLSRLLHPGKFKTVCVERLTEPLHLNMAALFVAAFGTFRAKVAFDLIIRQQYAFPMLYAADLANRYGLRRITVLEFGVATGAGLLNMCKIAGRVSRLTGIEFRIVGFDTGSGMPPAVDYRDLPDHFQAGDYPMNREALKRRLPSFAELIIGDVSATVPLFLSALSKSEPIGFVSVDVDYYSSAKAALAVFSGSPDQYLPITPVYLDDIGVAGSNPWTGELLAVREFNQEQRVRRIAPFTLLRSRRVFKNPQWIDRMYMCHIHDHPMRSPGVQQRPQRYIPNEYIASQ